MVDHITAQHIQQLIFTPIKVVLCGVRATLDKASVGITIESTIVIYNTTIFIPGLVAGVCTSVDL